MRRTAVHRTVGPFTFCRPRWSKQAARAAVAAWLLGAPPVPLFARPSRSGVVPAAAILQLRWRKAGVLKDGIYIKRTDLFVSYLCLPDFLDEKSHHRWVASWCSAPWFLKKSCWLLNICPHIPNLTPNSVREWERKRIPLATFGATAGWTHSNLGGHARPGRGFAQTRSATEEEGAIHELPKDCELILLGLMERQQETTSFYIPMRCLVHQSVQSCFISLLMWIGREASVLYLRRI